MTVSSTARPDGERVGGMLLLERLRAELGGGRRAGAGPPTPHNMDCTPMRWP